MSGVIINLPYSSGAYPPAVGRRLGLGGEDWRLENWRLIDPYLADIAREASVYERRQVKIRRPVVIYPVSPVVADPWGLWAAELSEGEPDFQPGPAILPRTTTGKALDWSEKDRALILERTVGPFHRQIEEEARRLLEETPLVLVVTLRSFGSMPLPFEKSRQYPRPQAAVSTSEKKTPQGLAELAGNAFRTFRWWSELNWPQPHGACLPPGLAGHPRVRALGLSLCRGLYMDERTGAKKPAAAKVSRVLTTVFNLFDQELTRVARLRLTRAFKPKAASPVIKAKDLAVRNNKP